MHCCAQPTPPTCRKTTQLPLTLLSVSALACFFFVPSYATMRQLLALKESDPAQFASYAQMAVDAAKLAEEQPEAFKQLFQEVAAGAHIADFPGTGSYPARAPSCFAIEFR